MIALAKGESSGHIQQSFAFNGLLFNSVHYTVGTCSVGMHYHQQPHLCFLFEGKDWEKRSQQAYPRTAGNLYFYFAGEPHQTISRVQRTTNFILELDSFFLHQHNIGEEQIEEGLRRHPYSRTLMIRLIQELNTCRDTAAMELLVLELIFPTPIHKRHSPPPWVATLREMLDEYWDECLGLEEMAQATGLHPVNISKQFKLYFHCSFSEYRRRLKIEKSIQLMKTAQFSLTEIAYICGFTDQSHFIRAFKQTTGYLPKDIKKLQL